MEKDRSEEKQPSTGIPSDAVWGRLPPEEYTRPEYLETVYKRRYFNPLSAKIHADEWFARLNTFFYSGKLTQAVVNEIFKGFDVLQLGFASGSFERRIADQMNSKGIYHIEDFSAVRAIVEEPRLAPWLNVSIKERNFTVPNDQRYDVVIGYFLLHELPDAQKRAVLKRAFNALKPTGKMIFVDYARPFRFHPLGYPVKLFNRLFEPFAESLWYNEIQDFAPETDRLVWDKKTFFGNMYQFVVAQRR